METVVVYHWSSGAYINSLCLDFDELYQELVAQYGVPNIALVNQRLDF
jgi:hypothetical protein